MRLSELIVFIDRDLAFLQGAGAVLESKPVLSRVHGLKCNLKALRDHYELEGDIELSMRSTTKGVGPCQTSTPETTK